MTCLKNVIDGRSVKGEGQGTGKGTRRPYYTLVDVCLKVLA